LKRETLVDEAWSVLLPESSEGIPNDMAVLRMTAREMIEAQITVWYLSTAIWSPTPAEEEEAEEWMELSEEADEALSPAWDVDEEGETMESEEFSAVASEETSDTEA